MIFWVWLDLRGSVDLIWVNKAPSVVAGAPGDAAVIRPLLLMVRLWVVRLNNFWIRIHLSVFILIWDSVISIWVYWCVLRILIHLLYLLFAHCVDGPREPVPRIRILLVKGWYFIWVLSDTLVQYWHFFNAPKPWGRLVPSIITFIGASMFNGS